MGYPMARNLLRAGHDVASGVYFAYIKPSDGSGTTIKKFAIER